MMYYLLGLYLLGVVGSLCLWGKKHADLWWLQQLVTHLAWPVFIAVLGYARYLKKDRP